MSLIRCKCGRYTQNGIFCTNCQKSSTMHDVMNYKIEDEDLEEDELEELGFHIIDGYDDYEDED